MNDSKLTGHDAEPSTLIRTYSVRDIQVILGVSQPTAYKLAHSSLFHVVRVGRRLRVSKACFDSWLEGQKQGVSG